MTARPAFSYDELVTRNAGFVTEAEQKLLRSGRVFVCGVGGMGGAAIQSLVRAGVGHFALADMDTFEVSNLNRQLFATLDTVGQPKVAATVEAIARINPDARRTTHGAANSRTQRALARNASALLSSGTGVMGGTSMECSCSRTVRTRLAMLAWPAADMCIRSFAHMPQS